MDLITTPDMGAIHLMLLEELGDVYRAVRDGERAIENYQAALGLISNPADGDLTEVRIQTRIVQVFSEIKWSVGLDYLQRVTAARQTARAASLPGHPSGGPGSRGW